MVRKHRIHSERIVVVRVNRRLQFLKRLLLLTVLMALPVAAYQAARWWQGDQARILTAQNLKLQSDQTRAQQQIEELRQEISNLDMSNDLDRETIDQLRAQLVNWRLKSEDLESKIQFYLSLMDPLSTGDGVFVQRAEVLPMAEPGVYRYQVVVAQKSQNHDRVTGSAQFTFAGSRDDRLESLTLADVSDETAPVKIGFSFFQQIEGYLYFPDDFEPSGWMLDIDLQTPIRTTVSEAYEWPGISTE